MTGSSMKKKGVVSGIKRAAYTIGTRRVGRSALLKVLAYYKINNTAQRNLINAYNHYLNALNTRSRTNARESARQASQKFVNTLFRMYNKETSTKPGPIAQGIHNGVQRSILYWAPGVIYRQAVRRVTRPRTA